MHLKADWKPAQPSTNAKVKTDMPEKPTCPYFVHRCLYLFSGWPSMAFSPAFSTPVICSRIFHSCIFHPMMLNFPLLHFPPLQFCPYRIFHSCTFSRSNNYTHDVRFFLATIRSGRCAAGFYFGVGHGSGVEVFLKVIFKIRIRNAFSFIFATLY